jgi:hypothetical protein
VNKRPTYFAGAIVGTLSVIIAGAFGVPEMITGDLTNGYANLFILLLIMLLSVSLIVYIKERKSERKELMRTTMIASLWSVGSLVAVVILFYAINAVMKK